MGITLLIAGESSSGKTYSLKNLKDQKGIIYCSTEGAKTVPYKNDFAHIVKITKPSTMYSVIDKANNTKGVHTIVIDTLTYLLDICETHFVINSTNGLKGWSDFQQYFKVLVQDKIANSKLNFIITAHTHSVLNEQTMRMETSIPVKGALAKNGIESYFDNIVHTKIISVDELEEHPNDLLHITDLDRELGIKYVFQTRITKETLGHRIRIPGFEPKEVYIDNDAQQVIDRLKTIYTTDREELI